MRILIVKTSSMGDVVHALPLAVDIAHAQPDAQIDWLCEETFAAIPAMSRHVHSVQRVALRRWRRRPFDPAVWREVRRAKSALRDAHYDLVLDVQGLAKSAWLARWTGSPVTGFDSSTAREGIAAHFYQRSFDVPRTLHAIERCRRLGAAALGYSLTGAPRFGIASGAERRAQHEKKAVLLSTRVARPSCGMTSAGSSSNGGSVNGGSPVCCSPDRRRSDCVANYSPHECSTPKSARRPRSPQSPRRLQRQQSSSVWIRD